VFVLGCVRGGGGRMEIRGMRCGEGGEIEQGRGDQGLELAQTKPITSN